MNKFYLFYSVQYEDFFEEFENEELLYNHIDNVLKNHKGIIKFRVIEGKERKLVVKEKVEYEWEWTGPGIGELFSYTIEVLRLE